MAREPSAQPSPWPDDGALARALLNDDAAAWEHFSEQFHADLVPRLARLVRRVPAVGQGLGLAAVDDLAQGFLAEKVLPNKAAFFGKVAREELPQFWGYLWKSLRNYALDAARRAGPKLLRLDGAAGPSASDQAGTATADALPDPRAADPASGLRLHETMDEVSRRYARAMQYLHAGPDWTRYRAPYLAVILLSERLVLYQVLADAFERYETAETAFHAIDVAESLVDWPPSVGKRTFGPNGPSLEAAWARLAERARAGADVNYETTVEVLEIGRALWDQWLQRARKAVAESLGGWQEAWRMFPYWPRKGGGR